MWNGRAGSSACAWSGSSVDVRQFAAGVYSYCLAYSASVTSWCRTPARNARVGGVLNSPHLLGLGADVVYDGSAPGEEADAYLGVHGLRRIREGDHDHLQPADWQP